MMFFVWEIFEQIEGSGVRQHSGPSKSKSIVDEASSVDWVNNLVVSFQLQCNELPISLIVIYAVVATGKNVRQNPRIFICVNQLGNREFIWCQPNSRPCVAFAKIPGVGVGERNWYPPTIIREFRILVPNNRILLWRRGCNSPKKSFLYIKMVDVF